MWFRLWARGAKVAEISAQPAKVLFQLFNREICKIYTHFCKGLHASGLHRSCKGLHQMQQIASKTVTLSA